MIVKVYFDKLVDPLEIDVVDAPALKNRIADVMQSDRGVITVGAKGGRMVILDTAAIRAVA